MDTVDHLLDNDGKPYEDLLTLEPIPKRNAYLLHGRYYDINSLHSYITSICNTHVIPHTRQVFSQHDRNHIINAYNEYKKGDHQRHNIKTFEKGRTYFDVEYVIVRELLPAGSILYEKDEHGIIKKCMLVCPLFAGNMTCFVHTQEKVLKACDVIGYSTPDDQIGVV